MHLQKVNIVTLYIFFPFALKNLMRDYDRSVRPSRNAGEPLNITFGLALTQIIDVVCLHCA